MQTSRKYYTLGIFQCQRVCSRKWPYLEPTYKLQAYPTQTWAVGKVCFRCLASTSLTVLFPKVFLLWRLSPMITCCIPGSSPALHFFNACPDLGTSQPNYSFPWSPTSISCQVSQFPQGLFFTQWHPEVKMSSTSVTSERNSSTLHLHLHILN